MKLDGKYRYSLQFDDKSLVNRQVGEFLERMGNRKSRIVVAAVLDFMRAHPEFLSFKTKVDIYLKSLPPETDLRAIVEELVRECLTQGVEQSVALVQEEDDPSGNTVSSPKSVP